MTQPAPAIIDAFIEAALVAQAHREGGEPGCLLRAAASSGQTEWVGQLLKRGADRSLRNSLGLTAADYARQRGHDDVVQLLA